MRAVYEQDFYRWAQEQAAMLKGGRLSELDIEHLAEEIESMGKSEKRELESRWVVLLQHLLKWKFQPTHRSRSWRLTIQDQRRMIPRHLRDNPSLASNLPELLVDAYDLAKGKTSDETDMPESSFPADCPWTAEQALNPDYLP